MPLSLLARYLFLVVLTSFPYQSQHTNVMIELASLIISWILVGLIWIIQLVHYPSFAYVSPSEFVAFHQHHTSSIAPIVLPLMTAELAITTYLAYQCSFDWSYLLPLLIVLAIWGSTFFIAVPLHQQLAFAKNDISITQLVQTNWIRTLLWTLKALLLTRLFL